MAGHAWHRGNHFFLMMAACVVPVIVLIVGKSIFKWKDTTFLTWAILLGCIIMHAVMMMQGGCDHGKGKEKR